MIELLWWHINITLNIYNIQVNTKDMVELKVRSHALPESKL